MLIYQKLITISEWKGPKKFAPCNSIGERNMGIPYKDDEECVYVKYNDIWYESCIGAINANDYSPTWAWKLTEKIIKLCEAH